MPVHFFDTSAISKHYHVESGTANVDALLGLPNVRQVISRLSVVEFHSVFAKKVRIGELDPAHFQKLTRRFRGDVGARRLRVIRLTAAHFQLAERLIRRIGLTNGLRTLDWPSRSLSTNPVSRSSLFVPIVRFAPSPSARGFPS